MAHRAPNYNFFDVNSNEQDAMGIGANNFIPDESPESDDSFFTKLEKAIEQSDEETLQELLDETPRPPQEHLNKMIFSPIRRETRLTAKSPAPGTSRTLLSKDAERKPPGGSKRTNKPLEGRSTITGSTKHGTSHLSSARAPLPLGGVKKKVPTGTNSTFAAKTTVNRSATARSPIVGSEKPGSSRALQARAALPLGGKKEPVGMKRSQGATTTNYKSPKAGFTLGKPGTSRGLLPKLPLGGIKKKEPSVSLMERRARSTIVQPQASMSGLRAPLKDVEKPISTKQTNGKAAGTDSSKHVTTCPVCLEPLDDSRSCSVTKCGHIFCTGCIELVMKSHKECPNCRQVLGLTGIFPVYL